MNPLIERKQYFDFTETLKLWYNRRYEAFILNRKKKQFKIYSVVPHVTASCISQAYLKTKHMINPSIDQMTNSFFGILVKLHFYFLVFHILHI